MAKVDHHLHEIVLSVPAGYQDASVNVFVAPSRPSRAPEATFTVAREPRSELALEDQAEEVLARALGALDEIAVLARRSRQVGSLPAYEARFLAGRGKRATYQRIAFVSYYETLLVLTAATPRPKRARCDQLADEWLDTLRFRSRKS